MYIIKEALDAGKNVAIGFRDTPVGLNDPYTVAERMEMFRQIFADMGIDKERYTLVEVPDIESVNIGRKVGYEVVRYDAPVDVEGISATLIRVAMENSDESWKTKVPRAVVEYLACLDAMRDGPVGSVIWLTGLPCSGKTTIAKGIVNAAGVLLDAPVNVMHLDGDVVRRGLCSDLGFSKEDRDENLRRIAHTAAIMADNGVTVLCSFVSPLKSQRDMIEDIAGPARFLLVHVDCPARECAVRDVKGMWAKASAGEIKDFTGLTAPYEEPLNADFIVHTDKEDVMSSVKSVALKINYLANLIRISKGS